MSDTKTTQAPTTERKARQVSTSVPAEYFDGLEDYRWTERVKISDIVRAALDEYVAARGIRVDGTAPAAK